MEQGGCVHRVVLDYELKRHYQRFLHERTCSLPGNTSRYHCNRSVGESLGWLCPERKRLAEPGAAPADARYLVASSAYRTPRYRALYRQWLDDPRSTLWMAGSPTRHDAAIANRTINMDGGVLSRVLESCGRWRALGIT